MNEVLINARTSPLPPAIAGNGDSDFVVVWNDIGGVNLKGQIFGADGTTSGSAFPINTTSEGTHFLPAATMLSGFSPGFVVAWISEGQFGGRQHRASARDRALDGLELRRKLGQCSSR
jgi:hypothetical protein